jgi:hypothetical protein
MGEDVIGITIIIVINGCQLVIPTSKPQKIKSSD